ncbi:MAG TPA: bifunctional lysylphosphatidylglycerol flippase/synthetase MprF [Steroidobacteraceae bacterium]|nr:bifunctional lysylphosphatidylglycerol flippase/synthetase MprF [Steroidobacteraceae bacterium]
MSTQAHPARSSLHYLPAVASLLLFAVALFALHRLAGEFHLSDVRSAFHSIPAPSIARALLFAAGSYFLLTQYERLAMRYAGGDLPYSRIAFTSFIAYSIGHNLGVSALSGGAIRLRLYSAAGLSGPQIAQIVAFGSLTFVLGAMTLTGVSLIVDAGAASSLLHASRTIAIAGGTVLLLLVCAYLAATALRRAPVALRDWSVAPPSTRLTLQQITVSALDLLCVSATLYALLPAASDVSFWAFSGLFMVAMSAGVLSAVPGGLGVFEAVFVVLLPGVPAPQLLGVLIAYRLVYYVLPFLISVGLLVGHELWPQRHRIVRAASWTGRSLNLIAPQATAALCFGAGLVLLLSGSTPGLTARLAALQEILPLPVLELSHLVGSAIGAALLILARGLYRRIDGARLIALWLLGAGILVSLLKGLDWEEAVVLAVVAAVLIATRGQFHRRASLLAEPLSPMWIASVCIAIGASAYIGVLANRRIPYAHELWWQFAFDGNAPRMLRATLAAALVLGGYALLRLLRPARRVQTDAPVPEARLLELVRSCDDGAANLALLGDKRLFFNESGRSFIMYAVSGRTWVAMGDPIGPAPDHEELIWRFLEEADRYGCRPAFYEISPETLPAYIDAGLGLSKLGEEARVRLEGFSLEGGARSGLRQSHRRGQRDGLSFLIAPPTEYPQRRARLREISDEWLAAKGVAEKGFSLGFFDDDYLRHFSIALVIHEGRPVAFANLWESQGREELSVDLMRHDNAAPRSVMDYLFIELMLWGSAQGYRWFNLGMAPLAGLEAHRLAPAWHKLGRLVYRLGAEFYNFDGLREYKDKFAPQWRPRYLAAPGRLALARVLLDVTLLISGGLRGAVLKGKPAQATG